MSTTAEIRRQNLINLIEEFGTQEAVAARAGTSQVYISQLRTSARDSKTGRPREVGARLARNLEQGCGKVTGWMDVEHVKPTDAGQVEGALSVTPKDVAGHAVEDFHRPYIVQTASVWPFTLFSYSEWLGLPAKTRDSFENEIAGALLRHRQTATGT